MLNLKPLTRRQLYGYLWCFVVSTFIALALGFMQTIDYYEALEREHEAKILLNKYRHEAVVQDQQLLELKTAAADCSGGQCMLKPKKQNIPQRNNNPLNIKRANEKWQGQIGVDKFGHVIFSDPHYGVRAAANVLINYTSTHNINTLSGIVKRFSTDNHAEYITFLSKRLKLGKHEEFDVVDRLPELLHAMAKFESGVEWDKSYFAPYSLLSKVAVSEK